jgi:membrane-associated protease RseP (regulator of RpoE activity)
MEAGQRIGIFLLGLLMVVAFYNDINRFFTG